MIVHLIITIIRITKHDSNNNEYIYIYIYIYILIRLSIVRAGPPLVCSHLRAFDAHTSSCKIACDMTAPAPAISNQQSAISTSTSNQHTSTRLCYGRFLHQDVPWKNLIGVCFLDGPMDTWEFHF